MTPEIEVNDSAARSSDPKPLRILHIITSLPRSGAETMLTRLIEATQGNRLDHRVLCLLQRGDLAGRIERAGGRVDALGLTRRTPNPLRLIAIRKVIKEWRPDLVQTWMYHSDLAGTIAAAGTGTPIVWNLRQSDLDSGLNRWTTVKIAELCARLSRRFPRRIIAGSYAAQTAHIRTKYDPSKITVITNGFDTDAFKPMPSARGLVSDRLGIPLEAPRIGYAARLHPHKGHLILLDAFRRIQHQIPDVHLILFGREMDPQNPFWQKQANLGLVPSDRIHLVGEQSNPALWLSSLDLLVSPSLSEGFPNTIGEAMACGVPCVATDAGDSAHLIGDTGRIVPVGDPDALSRSVVEMLQLDPSERLDHATRARKRILDHFSMDRIAADYERTYREVSQCVE